MTQVPLPAPVVQPGYPAHRRIVEAFGTEVLLENGDIDRKVLGDLIFNQPDRRHLLNSITHPEICKEMMKETFKYFLRGKSRTWDQAGQSQFLQARTLLCREIDHGGRNQFSCRLLNSLCSLASPVQPGTILRKMK